MILYDDEMDMNGGLIQGTNNMYAYDSSENKYDMIRYNGDF
jgi:hypothetical protein